MCSGRLPTNIYLFLLDSTPSRKKIRNTPSSRYLYKFVEHLRLPSLTIVGSVIGHEGIDPRNMLWWTWLAIPWSPSARTVVTNLLTVIARAPPPRCA